MQRIANCLAVFLLWASLALGQALPPEQPIPAEPLWPDLPPADNIQGDDPGVGPPLQELPPQAEYKPDVPEVPMISLSPEELEKIERKSVPASNPDTPFFPYQRGPSQETLQPSLTQSKLPPGYTTRAACLEEEEEVENGAVLFGIEPRKIPVNYPNGPWIE